MTTPVTFLRQLLALFVTMGLFGLLGASAHAQEFDLDQYQIQPEDELAIYVWKEPELQKEVIVRPDGGISFPLVGNLHAAGKTNGELQDLVTEKIREYIPDAVVNVSITELRGMRIYIDGKVNKPGEYKMGRYIDVLQALTLAGGTTPFADTSNIKILRGSGESATVFKFNYSQVQRGKNLQQNILLKPNDTVVVP